MHLDGQSALAILEIFFPSTGLFVYPLDEYTTVVGFEAMIAEKVVTVQIKDKARLDDCYVDCCSLPDGKGPEEGGERGRGGKRAW